MFEWFPRGIKTFNGNVADIYQKQRMCVAITIIYCKW